MHKALQCVLRKMIISEIKNIWDNIAITNSYEDVFDEGITKGFVNWQIYGSRKPLNKAYYLSYFFELTYDSEDEIWNFKETSSSKINIQQHLPLMSARYNSHQSFEVNNNESLTQKIEFEKKELKNREHKAKVNITNSKVNLDVFDLSKIDNMLTLDNLIECFLEEIACADYEVKETHQFTMILPESYYNSGAYNKWIRVGWALKIRTKNYF